MSFVSVFLFIIGVLLITVFFHEVQRYCGWTKQQGFFETVKEEYRKILRSRYASQGNYWDYKREEEEELHPNYNSKGNLVDFQSYRVRKARRKTGTDSWH